MAAPPHTSILEVSKNVLISPWKGKLTIQGCMLCDITLWPNYGAVIPAHLPHELDFKYVMQVSSLKERLPEAAFRKQIYLEQKVCYQDLCFNLYEVELSNKQRKEVDTLTEYIKNNQLAIIKCLEDRAFFILLSSAALITEPDIGDEQMSLHVLHLFHSPLATEVKALKIEDDISWKVAPILSTLNCALLEAKKLFPEEGTHPNILVKHNFQELNKVDKSLSLTAAPQDVKKETTFFRKLSGSFDLVPPPEKCSTESLTQLKSYFSDPRGYTLEVSTALGLLAERPPSPYISDGICDAGFSLVMTPDPEFPDSEAEVRKETQTEKSSEEMFKAKKGAVVPLSAASNLRVQPKRKASMLPIMPSKRVNLCRPFAKRATAGTDSRSYSPPTLKLVKGQLPQKRKRGAEVLTAQFVQKTKSNRRNQEVPISKEVPVATNTKRARRQEKSTVKTVTRVKPPVKKSPQKQRVNTVKGSQNPRIRKQPQPAKEETALQLQSEISSDGQKDGNSINVDQPQSTTVAQKDLPEDSIVNYDSQALNMLADLALSSAASSTPLCEARNLPCSSELPQNNILLSKESSLCGTPDHDYHSGVKSQKGVLLSKSSCDPKSNSGSGLIVSQEEENLITCSQMPADAQSALHEETSEPLGTGPNCPITVEHSYALLLGEHSKKYLQQRGLSGPAFAKTGTKGPEAGTPVGKVTPFRHLQNTSPLQKLSEGSLVPRRGRFISSNLKSVFCSHTIISCDGSYKVTFKCETEYAFNLDSKYTNNPLEKTIVRALHGPWNTNLPDNMEEVKFLIHMWVALFYRKRNKDIQSSRKVVEHSNPAKYVSINSTLESFELSEIEESSSVERCSIEPLLETNEMSRAHGDEESFHGPNCLLPLIKVPPSRGLGFCVQNERKEIFATECHPHNSENQNLIYSYNNEVIGGKAKQESADKLEAPNLALSLIGNTQTNGPFISDEHKTFQSLDSKRMVSYNGAGTQATFTRTCDEASSQSTMCEKSVYIPLESRVDILHTAVPTNPSALQDFIQCSSPMNNECESSLERPDADMEYVMINLEPVTFTLENNPCVPVHTEVNRAEKPVAFSRELINQVSPAADVRHPVTALEEVQTQAIRDVPSLAVSGQRSTQCLSASSGKRETLDEELLFVQKEMPLPVSSPLPDRALIMEALSLVKCSGYPLPSKEMKHSQDICLQTQNLCRISSEEIIDSSQVEVVSPSVSASLEKRYSNDCVPPKSNISDDSLELRKNDKSGLNCENTNLESFNSVFAKQTNSPINGQEIGLELQEANSDIDLTLTITPPTSPRGKVPANETEKLEEAPGSNLELKDVAEEIIEPKEVTFIEKTEANPPSSMSVYSAGSNEPLKNERKGDSLQPITLILSKENCTLEIGEEINVTSDFPFDSLIEEVSPASSPDPPVPTEEAWPPQAVSPCSLKLHGTQCEKGNRFSQIESNDTAVTEKENSSIDPSRLVRQENITQLQQIQLSAKMPLLTDHPGGKGTLMFPGKITEEIVPREHGEGLSFSEKVQCYDAELNKHGLVANYGDNSKLSLEKLVKSGNPLQPISIENRNLDLKHLVLESNESSFSSRKSFENKSLADGLVSTTALSGTVNIPLKEQGSPESIKENLCNGNLKTDGGNHMQVKSVNSAAIDGADVTVQAYLHPEIPEFDSASNSATLTQCTRPESIELGFQTQEKPVIRMASLLGNIGAEAELLEVTGVGSNSLQSNSTVSTKSEETVCLFSDTSVCEMKELLNADFLPTYVCSYQNNIDASEEPPAAFVPESVETLVYGVSKEHTDRKTASEGHGDEVDSKILGRNIDVNMNSDMQYEQLSGDTDQDSFSNCRNPKLDMENSGILSSYTSKNEHVVKDSCDSFMCLNNSNNEACDYSNKVPEVEMNIPPRNWATGLKKANKHVPRYVQIQDRHGIPRTYANFTITREFKNTTRTLHRVRTPPSFTVNSDLLSSWTSTWQVADDLTQNTLDLEYLRFAHKIKQLVKKESSRQSDSSLQISLRDFPFTEMSEPPVLLPTPRSRSPILVTVMHSDARWQSWHRSCQTPSDLDSSSSFWRERFSHSRNLTDSQRNETVSFHLNKLKYNSTLKESRNISLILNEYAEFNKVMMNSNHADFQDKELNIASEEATSQEIHPFFPRQSTSYEDVITDLCASLHTKLNSILKEACKSPFFFYLVETGDKPFFLGTKSILKKGGHTEIEPQHFCHTFHGENDTLIVIIRNEDISSHLHRIPSLLKLKHLPGVIFAGVDNPEDVLNDTHQELFHTGGFVVSDDKILETVTLAQLKEIVKILEKLSGNGRWKWLLHYRENKKLKENVRMDSVAHKKNLILRSYQNASIIELLPYHQCDCRSQTKAEILKCLINLQIQHVDARFAVFLTDKHFSSEIFGNNGILAIDVNDFIENIQKIAAPFRSSYW